MKKKRANDIKNYKIPNQDDLVTDYIKDQLEEKMQASAMDINVFCENGHVHMSGMVDVLSEKKTAEAIAKGIERVKRIENKITVAMDSNITDKHMQKEVMARLIGVDHLLGVGVKIEDGVANLLGSTNTLKDAHTAMSIASQIRGIKDVVNNIHISTAQKYDDSRINSNVTQVLSTTDLDYMDIAHSVDHGKLTLSGYVHNKTEMEFAKEIAMGVEGITKVINKLKVRKR
ncbi:BON domain-containing protein [Marinisporobacter balticus]|uniref:Osmotically-inducible protein OsmY n=1 Tax=Marinisporobacter balticus TaxID=2018667 RepID=A0A4R2KFF5_9FIRM|nr:BON domain-containing protein [Marinisporobacter balticus]TCO71794.1 osmotically-inducible protein OsmY [Marinisporobacter balticus]